MDDADVYKASRAASCSKSKHHSGQPHYPTVHSSSWLRSFALPLVTLMFSCRTMRRVDCRCSSGVERSTLYTKLMRVLQCIATGGSPGWHGQQLPCVSATKRCVQSLPRSSCMTSMLKAGQFRETRVNCIFGQHMRLSFIHDDCQPNLLCISRSSRSPTLCTTNLRKPVTRAPAKVLRMVPYGRMFVGACKSLHLRKVPQTSPLGSKCLCFLFVP